MGVIGKAVGFTGTVIGLVAPVVTVVSVVKGGDKMLTDGLNLDKPGWYPGKRLLRLWRGGGRGIREAIFLSENAQTEGSASKHAKKRKN